MNRFLLKNDTVDNVSARLTVTPSGELSNLGQAGATVIEGNKLTTCLAPTTVTIKEPEAFKSDVIELSEDNKYVVEVNGVVVPFIFTPDQLPLYFDGSEERPVIQFKEYVQPPISCVGATTAFMATTSFETNLIEVQINDGPWQGINGITEISANLMPGSPGASLKLELTDDQTPKRIRLRTTRDIGLYVDPTRSIDQVTTNKAYTLFDRSGNVIDPLDPINHDYSGAEFDNATTALDYAVFFATAELCLAPESSHCSILPTTIPTTLPEFHMFAARKPYVLTAVITEAGVTRTQKVTLDHTNSNFQGSEATIFKRMLGAIGLSKLGTPGENWTPIYGLVSIQPQSTEEVGKILGFGYGNVEEPWNNVIEDGDNPVNISFLPTTTSGTATDLYSFINTTDVVHSCGWAKTGNAVGVFTDEDAYFRPAFITIEDVT